jgi:hypothetical protein
MAELNAKLVSKLCISSVETWKLPNWLACLMNLLEKAKEQKSEYVELNFTTEILDGLITLLKEKLSNNENLFAWSESKMEK